jgi:hypothetical protein
VFQCRHLQEAGVYSSLHRLAISWNVFQQKAVQIFTAGRLVLLCPLLSQQHQGTSKGEDCHSWCSLSWCSVATKAGTELRHSQRPWSSKLACLRVFSRTQGHCSCLAVMWPRTLIVSEELWVSICVHGKPRKAL